MENNENSHGITVTRRDLPPAHFLLKIKSFSLLRETGLEKYESDVFEAGGYTWRLCLYPNGYPKGNRFVCLSLQLERTGSLRGQWVVNAEFKLFVYDRIKKEYLTVQGITGTKRDLPPAHFSLRIESFSLLRDTAVEKYESDVFEAGNYKWRLCLYPNGNPKGKRFVSVYLKLENTSDLRDPWEVNAEFKLFVFDQIKNKYLTVQDKNHPVKRFHETKTEWGFDQFLPLKTFKDSSKGYLVKDCCVFGAEVFVIKPTGKLELLSMVKKPANGSSTWKIEDFSKLDTNSPLYKTFTAVGRSWKVEVHPGGYGKGKGNSLSVFLELVDRDKLPPKKAFWAECKLRVLDQLRDKHFERTVRHWFTSSSLPRGSHKFMPLGDLLVSKGYVLNDTVIFEAEFLTLSVSELFP